MKFDPNLSPELLRSVPIINPKSRRQKLKDFFSPQVNAVIVAWLLTLGPTVYAAYTRGEKVHELEQKITGKDSEINRLTTENKSLENERATYAAIPARTPKLIDELEYLLAHDPTNQQQLASIKTELGIISDGFQATVPRFALLWETKSY